MDERIAIAFVLAYGYLLGSIPMSYVTGRLVKGIDLRKVGSGTVGASNVWYNVGHAWIFPVSLFDVFVKGMSPALVARAFDLDLDVQVLASLLAVAGHNWPVFLKFQGGRGIAPTVGMLLAMGRLELAVFMVVSTAGWQLTQSSAVWVLIAFATMPLVSLWLGRPTEYAGLMAGVLVITIAKRLASNSLSSPGVSFPRLMLNRLLFDRDIADHDVWMTRNTASE
ncbi:MAG: glycerol-3-phosphate acyltransferase [Chloroflexi bacterium]|nr:glycerol-3-phosphate acyltransferase [Chloroflexota bacterium]